MRSAMESSFIGPKGMTAMDWFWERQQAHKFEIERISFNDLLAWDFDSKTGNLHHESGKFFTVRGIKVETNFGSRIRWRQPIIDQHEVGILGVITSEFDGVLHFLMQVKMEPGNINMVQLSPTLQATRSNFTCVHKGRKPAYLDYFIDYKRHNVLVDSLQSEQGGRFLSKRNRNMIIQVDEDVPLLPDYAWMTLGQIQQLLRIDNIVNMDTRTVLGCIPLDDDHGIAASEHDGFPVLLLRSINSRNSTLNTMDQLLSWFTEQKVRYMLEVETIPLKDVYEWERGEFEIQHREKDYFSIIACRVEADNREVGAWTQPLVKPPDSGIVALVVRPINGVLHFLIQAKVEPGNMDIVEMAPTVQCTTGDYRRVETDRRPPYLNYVLNCPADQIVLDVHLSEEGGRFFREANRNMVVLAGDDVSVKNIPDNYAWMTLAQIKEFIKYNNYLNVECRCLVSCLGFIED